jgi:hypothetical protein
LWTRELFEAQALNKRGKKQGKETVNLVDGLAKVASVTTDKLIVAVSDERAVNIFT